MRSIAQRARALEAKFAHDQEILFKVEAQRNKLIGLWAASLLNKEDPTAYASTLCQFGVEKPDAIASRLKQDFESAGLSVSEEAIQSKMVTLLRQAHEAMHISQ
ncbi:DUF1476 domain-containing protein [Rhizobium paknamense]|uniref:DUF1476 domain-containing protein n=1 Tax=Rhizobium paknamense TaxID=1206817 RepID=A0ABU0IBR9_9HYPH|nr:DUF1476 domain-containing protein [Rhizobium paknamense]MDQ0454910.1 hypothetical protein [Rhizobium paknamense]